MWIKLVSQATTARPMDSVWKTRMAPPLSLLILGSLTPDRHRVTLEDENVGKIFLDDRPDLLGITVKVDTAPRGIRKAGFVSEAEGKAGRIRSYCRGVAAPCTSPGLTSSMPKSFLAMMTGIVFHPRRRQAMKRFGPATIL